VLSERLVDVIDVVAAGELSEHASMSACPREPRRA
jgi:hypothetical protein